MSEANIILHPVRQVKAVRVEGEGQQILDDLVVTEEPMEIRLGFGAEDDRQQLSVAVTMRTPGHDLELAAGFLITEGIIPGYSAIHSIRHCKDISRNDVPGQVVRVELQPDVSVDWTSAQRNFYTTSACGVCGKASIDAVLVKCPAVEHRVKVKPKVISDLPVRLRDRQKLFERTGALHAAGLFSLAGEPLLVREDAGRHNAVDKLVGAWAATGRLPALENILVLSGRISFELVQKAALAGIPLIVAVGAPSSLAIDLARTRGITLCGFVRDARFNVYCGNALEGISV